MEKCPVCDAPLLKREYTYTSKDVVFETLYSCINQECPVRLKGFMTEKEILDISMTVMIILKILKDSTRSLLL